MSALIANWQSAISRQNEATYEEASRVHPSSTLQNYVPWQRESSQNSFRLEPNTWKLNERRGPQGKPRQRWLIMRYLLNSATQLRPKMSSIDTKHQSKVMFLWPYCIGLHHIVWRPCYFVQLDRVCYWFIRSILLFTSPANWNLWNLLDFDQFLFFILCCPKLDHISSSVPEQINTGDIDAQIHRNMDMQAYIQIFIGLWDKILLSEWLKFSAVESDTFFFRFK